MYNPAHAGLLVADCLEGLKEEGMNVTITALASHIGVTRATLSRIVNGHQAITPDIALRLQDALGLDSGLLLRMQLAYDTWQAQQQPRPQIQPPTAKCTVATRIGGTLVNPTQKKSLSKIS